jgi:hypothetical protein
LIASRKTFERQDGVPTDEVVAGLAELLPDCRDAFTRLAESELASPSSDEFTIDSVLTVLLGGGGGADVLALVGRALESPGTRLKEEYASMLADAGAPSDAVAALVRILERGRAGPRGDLPETIHALHGLRASEATASVAPYLADPDFGVRGQAIDFMYACGAPATAGPALIEPWRRSTSRRFSSRSSPA